MQLHDFNGPQWFDCIVSSQRRLVDHFYQL
jgi:hypothetical protein